MDIGVLKIHAEGIGGVVPALLIVFIARYLYKYGKMALHYVDSFVTRHNLTMLIWDLSIFGRSYFLNIMDKRQYLIDKARKENNRIMYLTITRAHFLVGFISLAYVIYNIMLSDNHMQALIDMASNTIAGTIWTLIDVLALDIQPKYPLWLTFFIAGIVNYLVNWIFMPRYDSEKDKESINIITRLPLSVLEVVLFTSTTLLLSDLFNSEFFSWVPKFIIELTNTTSQFFARPEFSWCYILWFILACLFSHILIKALLNWFEDILNLIVIVAGIAVIAAVVLTLLGDVAVDEKVFFIVSILLIQRVARIITAELFEDYDDEKVPRRYIYRRYQKRNQKLPEYYDEEWADIEYGELVQRKRKSKGNIPNDSPNNQIHDTDSLYDYNFTDDTL